MKEVDTTKGTLIAIGGLVSEEDRIVADRILEKTVTEVSSGIRLVEHDGASYFHHEGKPVVNKGRIVLPGAKSLSEANLGILNKMRKKKPTTADMECQVVLNIFPAGVLAGCRGDCPMKDWECKTKSATVPGGVVFISCECKWRPSLDQFLKDLPGIIGGWFNYGPH